MDSVKVHSIQELHKMLGYAYPNHSLITLVDLTNIASLLNYSNQIISGDFYTIIMKEGDECGLKYGRKYFDFKEGSLNFTAPWQHMIIEVSEKINEGWMLLFHPDLIRQTSLYNKMNEYTFFSYKVTEALHMSEKEKQMINSVVSHIRDEIENGDDAFTNELIVTNIEMLLGYAKRFYGRQFITRQVVNKDIESKLSDYLNTYYNTGAFEVEGTPSVKLIAEYLGYSSNYFGDLVKKETGDNAKDYIHRFIIEKAKDLLLGTDEPVSEIAFRLGFGYVANFSKFFKKKVGVSPAEYRK